jgi:hypothetical protein
MRNIIPVVLLALYAGVIFLNPNTEWVCWAASMSSGVLCVNEPPAIQQVLTGEATHIMTVLGALGALVMAGYLALKRN